MKIRKASFFLALATLVCSAGQSNAGILTFTSQTAYNTAIAARSPLNTRLDDFNALSGPVGAVSSYVTSGSGVTATYSIVSSFQLAVSNATTPTPSLGINDPFDPTLTEDLTITLGPAGRGIALQVISNSTIGGISGDFLVNANGADGMGATNVEMAATGVAGTAIGGGYTSYFFGFVADTPLDSLTNAVVSTTSALNGYRIDNVSFAAVAVPEPSSLALLGLASVIGFARRRASRTK